MLRFSGWRPAHHNAGKARPPVQGQCALCRSEYSAAPKSPPSFRSRPR
jgi:hypothetical protein